MFDLVVFFLGNFLRNTSGTVLLSPIQSLVMVWVFFLLLFFPFSLFSFFQWKFSEFGSLNFKSLLIQNIKSK